MASKRIQDITKKCLNCDKEYHPYINYFRNKKEYTKFCSITCRNKYYKGIKLSEEHKHKVSIALKGKKRSPCTPEHRKKISIAKKGCKGTPCSEEIKKLFSESRRGSNGSNWKGGTSTISDRLRHSLQYNEWRKSVYERDDYACQICGQKSSGNLNADHIIPFCKIIEKLRFEQGIDNLYNKALFYPLLWDVNNGRTLCIKCHRKTDTYGFRKEYKKNG